MKSPFKPTDILTFRTLADECGIKINTIEFDYLNGCINKFMFMRRKNIWGEPTRERINRLMEVLNKYARAHITEDPIHTLSVGGADPTSISVDRQKMLLDNIKSDSIFKMWLNEYGVDLYTIKLVIPADEAIKYISYRRGNINPVSDLHNGTPSVCCQKVQEVPNMKGHKGPLKKMILGGLQAYYDEKKCLPPNGKSFQIFLDFLYKQFNKNERPDYFSRIRKVKKVTDNKAVCITTNETSTKKNPEKKLKYVANQFYEFLKDFTPQATSEKVTNP